MRRSSPLSLDVAVPQLSQAGVPTELRYAALEKFRDHLESVDWSDLTASRRQILEAFLRLSVLHGTAVSMRTLAKEINIKAPSIYAHFADGRDEIVAESLRWHFHRFGVALIDAVAGTRTADQFLDAMVRLHFTRQVRMPESNLWDLLVATDRMAHILPADLGHQVEGWVGLYESLYVAAAQDMGYVATSRRVKVIMTLLEGSTRWFDGEPTEDGLVTGATQAVALMREILRLPI